MICNQLKINNFYRSPEKCAERPQVPMANSTKTWRKLEASLPVYGVAVTGHGGLRVPPPAKCTWQAMPRSCKMMYF
jgi:hypothetical protein